jgi:hypothetical protein
MCNSTLSCASNVYAGFTGTTLQESDTTKYKHILSNSSVTFGALVTCQFDLGCGTLTASAIYGGVATQIHNTINSSIQSKRNTLQNIPGTGETLLESHLINRIFTVSPLEIKTYLNLSSSTDPKNANIEISLNQSGLFNQMYHCEGIVNSNAVVPLSKGSTGFTVSKPSTGVYVITFNTAHPSTPYLVSVSSAASARIISYSILSSTSMQVSTVTTGGNAIDTGFNFQVFLYLFFSK